MISGDDAAVGEAKAILGDLEGAVVKWNIGFHSAETLTPDAAYALIGQRVKAALGRLREFEPFRVAVPVSLEVTFKSYRPSQLLAYLPIVERIDAHSIRYVAEDIPAASVFLEFLLSYRADLEP